MKEINKLIKYSIIYMNYITYLGLFLPFFLCGVFLADKSSFYGLSRLKKIPVISGIITLIVFPVLIDKFTEKGHTLTKFVDYYDLQYGDTLDFVYHIKTDYQTDNTKKTPKCEISGNITKNNLTITKMKNCDNAKETKEKYLKLIGTFAITDNNSPISKGSKISNFDLTPEG
mgnify:CR=1 FL=1